MLFWHAFSDGRLEQYGGRTVSEMDVSSMYGSLCGQVVGSVKHQRANAPVLRWGRVVCM